MFELQVRRKGGAWEKGYDGWWVSISGRVQWQACDSEACALPEEKRFNFRVPAAFAVLGDMGPGEGRVPAMNGAAHFKEMMTRRQTQG